ncbi:exodeoxyribonuclease III [Bacteriovorax sp. DB6_IX]|uniref:exodeoxyribonuclease III n=1 Tax=Bacteriovorax sp. DB6_IX TaxID=1353530 RepID=UPI00038A0AC0|nr:exodeoxyribonuclease III [Bacteriovorax sp. DB6_IX]EQC43192.1 exodeoxyribonuclease III [Bacteriovorax sp. DB6_IX]
MQIASWNVAGLRACEKKGFYDWYLEQNPDIICLQETKALPEQLSDQLVHPENHEAIYAPAQKKGYSGVATWVRKGVNVKHTVGLGIEEFDCEGRTLISEFDNFILFNCYFPNGKRDHSRVPYKLEFSREVARQALELKEKTGKEVIITGDYNTAHHEIDLANPKTNKKSTGFLPIEREWMDEFQEQGFVDLFRHFNPGENGHYTWWTYRGDCRARNIGWRIDYFWCTAKFVGKVSECTHHPEILGSDHCPISMSF